MMDELSVEKVVNAEGETIEQESFNSIYMMAIPALGEVTRRFANLPECAA